jgi:hypothetical protein
MESTLLQRQEIEARLRIARILGTGAERKAARVRLGLTLDQVAELTGLSYAQIRTRESDKWQMKRSSLDGDGWRYVQFLAVARGMEELLTAPLGVDDE